MAKQLKWQAALLFTMATSMGIAIWIWSVWETFQHSGYKDIVQIRKDKTLTILTRNAPTTYFEGRDGPSGYEYDLTQALAEYMGVSVHYRFFDTVDDILQAVANGQGDIAAAGITRLPERESTGLFTPSYMSVRQQLVCNRSTPPPKKIHDLTRVSLMVSNGTSYLSTLENLKTELDGLTWTTAEGHSTEQIFEMVSEGKVDCTISDSNIIALNQRFYPRLKIAINLTEAQPLAWLLPEHSTGLHAALNHWFMLVRSSGQLADIHERNYGHIKPFDFVDTRAFRRRVVIRLPKYQEHFKEAAHKQDFPWTLLAALSYQESHWNNRARSPTGVRGLMMLTLSTARTLGLQSRLDPSQSIYGGARYLRSLIDRLPEGIKGPDRIWIGLAAYNLGMGHIFDARDLARRLDKDPDKWSDLKTVLPLLTRRDYYRTLKNGYARGMEAVQYVQRIRNYQDILERDLITNQQTALNP